MVEIVTLPERFLVHVNYGEKATICMERGNYDHFMVFLVGTFQRHIKMKAKLDMSSNCRWSTLATMCICQARKSEKN